MTANALRNESHEDVDYLAEVARLSPLIASMSSEIEAAAQLPDRLADALLDAGLYRMLLPTALGGGQVEPRLFVEVLERIARVDASTAWCIGQTSSCSMSAAVLHPEVGARIFLDPRGVMAWGPGKGRADIVEGGFRVTGDWSFASGCRQATWVGGLSTLYRDGQEVTDPATGKPVIKIMLFPVGQVAMRKSWNVIGLKGTGSDSYSVKDVFVPERHCLVQDDPRERHNHSPLYSVTSRNMYAMGFSGIALGIATAMLDQFIDIAKSKTPKGLQSTLKQSAVVQAGVAQARASLESSRVYMATTIDRVWSALKASGAPAMSLDDRVALRLAASHAIRQAYQVADYAFHAAGASAVYTGDPMERRFRDIVTLRQHIQGRDDLFEICGQYMLGDAPDFLSV
ncbi:MAG: acyl-CoA dehydrogenase family protein [Rhizobiaceae bacterium]